MFNILQHCFVHLLGRVLITSQLDALLFCVAGALVSQRLGIAPIGLHGHGVAKVKHKKKRVDRFLGNARVDTDAIALAIVRALALRAKRVVIATDWTEIGSLSVLTSAVVAHGRALPFYFTVVDTNVTRQRAVEFEHMEHLSKLLHGIDCVHVLDAGFDDAQFLGKLSVICKFVVRASRGICYRSDVHAEWSKIGCLEKRGRIYDFGRVQFTKEHCQEVRFVAVHDWAQKGPWFLVSNLYGEDRKNIVKLYGRRFTIEEAFKDLKDLRAGFQLKHHQTKCPKRLLKLLMIGAVAYLICTAAGLYGEQQGMHRELQVSSRKNRENAVWRVGRFLLFSERVSATSVVHEFGWVAQDVGRHSHAQAA